MATSINEAIAESEALRGEIYGMQEQFVAVQVGSPQKAARAVTKALDSEKIAKKMLPKLNKLRDETDNMNADGAWFEDRFNEIKGNTITAIDKMIEAMQGALGVFKILDD